jgi:hypothetical protein
MKWENILQCVDGTHNLIENPSTFARYGGILWPSDSGFRWEYPPDISNIDPYKYYTVYTVNKVKMTRIGDRIKWDNVLFVQVCTDINKSSQTINYGE